MVHVGQHLDARRRHELAQQRTLHIGHDEGDVGGAGQAQLGLPQHLGAAPQRQLLAGVAEPRGQVGLPVEPDEVQVDGVVGDEAVRRVLADLLQQLPGDVRPRQDRQLQVGAGLAQELLLLAEPGDDRDARAVQRAGCTARGARC